MINLFIFCIISINPALSENLPGEWMGNSGFFESPAVTGNVNVNPAAFDTVSLLSIQYNAFTDDYSAVGGNISNIYLTLNAPAGVVVGGNIGHLYDCSYDASVDSMIETYDYTQNFTRDGGIDRFGIFIGKNFGDLSLGLEGNILNGEIQDSWKIEFDSDFNTDVYDTTSLYIRGYSVGAGFSYEFDRLKLGGYLSFYQDIEKWYKGEEKSPLELTNPVRFGLTYRVSRGKKVLLSVDEKQGFAGFEYGPLKVGYSRIYSMGSDMDVSGNRFIGGISLNLAEIPVSFLFENRRYSGSIEDNMYIGSIRISISGLKGTSLEGGTQ